MIPARSIMILKVCIKSRLTLHPSKDCKPSALRPCSYPSLHLSPTVCRNACFFITGIKTTLSYQVGTFFTFEAQGKRAVGFPVLVCRQIIQLLKGVEEEPFSFRWQRIFMITHSSPSDIHFSAVWLLFSA